MWYRRIEDRLDVAVRPSGECFVVPRTGAGLDNLVARLKVLKPNLIVLEATGGFETVAVAALAAAGLPLAVDNPAQIRAFAKAIASANTDPIDAGVIAHFGEARRRGLAARNVNAPTLQIAAAVCSETAYSRPAMRAPGVLGWALRP